MAVVAVARRGALEDVPPPEVESQAERQKHHFVQRQREQVVDVVLRVVHGAEQQPQRLQVVRRAY